MEQAVSPPDPCAVVEEAQSPHVWQGAEPESPAAEGPWTSTTSPAVSEDWHSEEAAPASSAAPAATMPAPPLLTLPPTRAGMESAEAVLLRGASTCPESQATTEWQQSTAAPSSGTWSSQASPRVDMLQQVPQLVPQPPPPAPGTMAARSAPVPPPAAPLPWN